MLWMCIISQFNFKHNNPYFLFFTMQQFELPRSAISFSPIRSQTKINEEQNELPNYLDPVKQEQLTKYSENHDNNYHGKNQPSTTLISKQQNRLDKQDQESVAKHKKLMVLSKRIEMMRQRKEQVERKFKNCLRIKSQKNNVIRQELNLLEAKTTEGKQDFSKIIDYLSVQINSSNKNQLPFGRFKSQAPQKLAHAKSSENRRVSRSKFQNNQLKVNRLKKQKIIH